MIQSELKQYESNYYQVILTFKHVKLIDDTYLIDYTNYNTYNQ